ncbi:uncharacterized protein ACHE_80583A [Aspergillus chevalieri]|uniref:Calpain catalytic domain-containing protein n=1 Tax=Aspergillus chevalieri TaxID=182096 RepID=A0A7R7VXP2_ASPCH|nr:uncharacterized protein ACHE_80583A [Aspergillus chevalieri]BCR92683.1 hypothetical protein ACHE_80583A [Aspergillus chevalieri]
MAALCTLGNKKRLIDNICVARNEKVGVYGFVFFRDGEWQQCIVDDKLYLRAADYDESLDERQVWDDIIRRDTEEEYRKAFQTGSRALYFAQCADENEIWLPLLEKAFAKAHGDYCAIEGGFVGEAIEDLTGGVTVDILSSSILDKDRFWKEELMKVNQDFLFGCGTGFWSNWLCPKYQGRPRDRKGIFENHSYSIMEAREIDGHRLLRLRNPWGKKEWSGAWSDGSEQWTPEWMERLGHKFGNDGVFWISYEDLLKKYQHFERTRLFGREWAVTQQWTTLNVPWSADYHSTKFMITVRKESPVAIVLSQLDSRHFKGLAGEYDFALKFRVQKDGEEDYLVRSQSSHLLKRSANAEITLKPGRYCVLMNITAYRNPDVESTEEAVSRLASTRREKLVQIGLSYDLAHAKGRVVETEREKKAREEYEMRRRALDRKKRREETKKKLQKEWIRERKMAARKKRATERLTGRKDSFSCNESLGNGVLRKGSPEDSTVNSLATSGINGTTPTVQLNGYNKLKRKRDSRHLSIDTNFTADDFDSSDLELLDGFEFDSDIDLPEKPEPVKQAHRELSVYSPHESISGHWNAVCVVGLRVYSKDPKLSLEVVRPVPEDDVEAALDMDDPAVSATNERGGWDQFSF